MKIKETLSRVSPFLISEFAPYDIEVVENTDYTRYTRKSVAANIAEIEKFSLPLNPPSPISA